MLKTMLIVILLLGAGLVLMSVKILLKKNGRFPNTHVGHNPAMRKNKVGCIQSQDFQARRENRMAVSEKSK